jgi:hypothetical protein
MASSLLLMLAGGDLFGTCFFFVLIQQQLDDESDDDYSDHPVMGGMHSRPGSSLSMNNMMGGNGETSLTLEFSDLASVSGPSGLGQGGYSHQQHQQHQQPHHHQSYGGHNSVVSMTMAALGPGAITSTGLRPTSGSLSSLTGGSGNGGSGGADGGGGNGVGVDQKRKRKRREMQPVNKIVDSAEPHIDQFLWKNNGNTTQKKTGCKSIYYKCSNSANGCTVSLLGVFFLFSIDFAHCFFVSSRFFNFKEKKSGLFFCDNLYSSFFFF